MLRAACAALVRATSPCCPAALRCLSPGRQLRCGGHAPLRRGGEAPVFTDFALGPHGPRKRPPRKIEKKRASPVRGARKGSCMDQEKRNAVLEARSVLQERLNTLADNKDVFGDLPGTAAYAAALVLAVEAFDRWLEGGAEA